MRIGTRFVIVLGLLAAVAAQVRAADAGQPDQPSSTGQIWKQIAFAFQPPADLAGDFAAGVERPGALSVTDIKAVCRNGQTFVTWKDAAEGEAGARLRYSLYRSDQPITHENLARAELCYPGVLNNSCKRFGYAFSMKDRLDPAKPTFVIEEGSKPLPMWSGLAVRTVERNGKSFYAVLVTDEKYQPVGKVVPGQSATTEAVEETVAPIQPIKIGDSKTRGRYAMSSCITGTPNLPLLLNLHGSQASGGAAGDHGDLYVYFGTPQMGWRDGIPGIFSVTESHGKGAQLILFPRDAIESPRGDRAIETCWFGYCCVPQGATRKRSAGKDAEHDQPRAYPFTESRLLWIVDWVSKRYNADPQRVYSAGQSMGGMGSTQWAFRRPDIFAAVYPRLGRVRQTWLPCVAPGLPTSIQKSRWDKPVPLMDGGGLDYFTRMDTVRWVRQHHEDLPFYGWCFGKSDNVAPWTDNVEMVEALTAGHHGFAFSWNNHGHSSAGAKSMQEIIKYYPPEKFARHRSYPAFGHSSIDSVMGKERTEGDPVGGINLGFDWSDVVDEPDRWSAKFSNELAKEPMTADVTPRRCQQFKPQAGERFTWTNSAGGSGEVAADEHGLVTIERLKIAPGRTTTLTITR